MKYKQIIGIILIIFLLQLVFIPNISKAVDLGDVVTQGEEWLKNAKTMVDQTKLKDANSFLYNTLLIIGIIITVVWGGYIGIKLMLDSAEKKADIKEALMPYLIGCFAIYSGFAVWKLVVTILDKI